MRTFKEVSLLYLKYLQANIQTKRTYSNILNHHWNTLDGLLITDISTQDILEILVQKDITDKYLNQIMIPLRGTFNTAIMLNYIDTNPADYIHNRKIQHDLPDPFNKREMELILHWLKTNTNKNCYLFYELSFWSGLRPSEILALTADDITDKGIYVYKSTVRGIEKSITKTKTARLVLFNKKSKKVIKQLNRYGYLFTTPYGLAYKNNEHFREKFKLAIKANQIRDRPAYNTRHTYATMLLMSGVNPVFVANQLGHNLLTLLTKYARWINSEQDKKEIAKLQL